MLSKHIYILKCLYEYINSTMGELKQYMVEIFLPKKIDEDFLALLSSQKNLINDLFEEGKVLAYSLALDRSRLWLTMSAENDDQIREIINEFPIAKKIRYIISELFFNRMTSPYSIRLSLN